MGKPIARHSLGLPDNRLEYEIARAEKGLRGFARAEQLKLDQVNAAIRYASQLAGLRSIVSPSDAGIKEALSLVATGAVGVFAAMAASGNTATVDLGGASASTILSSGPSAHANTRTWRFGFYSALACRDGNSLDALASAPLDLIRKSSVTTDEFGYLHVDALQAWRRGDSDAAERLLAAFKAADPDKVSADMKDYVLDIANREMELLTQLLNRKADEFNTALAKALKDHKRYHKAGKRKLATHNYLALGPLGLCCAAHDVGMAITVESDYIPNHLIAGS